MRHRVIELYTCAECDSILVLVDLDFPQTFICPTCGEEYVVECE